MGRDERIARMVGDAAEKTTRAAASGNKADAKGAEAAYDEMKQKAIKAGLLDPDPGT
jgi:hypothetical protein